MLKLGDFFHLPEVDTLVEQLIDNEPGLFIVAGLDPRPIAQTPVAGGFLPSGRSAIFRILMREMLAACQSGSCFVIGEDKSAARVPRQFRRRTRFLPVGLGATYAEQIAEAVPFQPGLLVLDRLCSESVPAALEAAQRGVRVLSQLDTVFRGADVVRHLLDLGAGHDQIDSLSWVVAVQRLAALCPHCAQPVSLDAFQLDRLRHSYADLDDLIRSWATESNAESDGDGEQNTTGHQAETFFEAGGCEHCDHTGRRGDVVVFDFFHLAGSDPASLEQRSILSMEDYVLRLALHGHLSPDDVLGFEADQFHRTYHLLVTSEHALVEANTELERKLVELETAHRVMEQRTRALISLQDIGQALISSTDLVDLADQVCRRVHDLCGADRAILYFRRVPGRAEVLAVSGWDPALIHQQFDADFVFQAALDVIPSSFNRWPPGIPPRSPDIEGAALRAGLSVPLIAQEEAVGLMIVHTTFKPRFEPGEVALLQTFANQAALAIQRADLIEDLRAKIIQLEAAQAELAQKERMERELELARQVQQSVLPRTFPQVPGYCFAACNEPARQVGGDFYDVILLDNDYFGVAIADVSDKGMPAALYMALTRSLLLAEARRERSPRAVLSSVNRLLLELGEPNMFVTVFYGVVECSTRRLTYTRAGHDRPVLLRQDSAKELSGQGAALGLLEPEMLPLFEEQIDLAPGDRLVLYTDGLTDVTSPTGQLFDRGRLIHLLQSYGDMSPDELCAATFDDLTDYQGGTQQFDDMTMLVVQIE
ncbi:MAG: SpoIIE family protein phosphatase [Anaerolineae bacterium]|nr:SpoIIE family protein phosphatase [Anaerolineae bacterium]